MLELYSLHTCLSMDTVFQCRAVIFVVPVFFRGVDDVLKEKMHILDWAVRWHFCPRKRTTESSQNTQSHNQLGWKRPKYSWDHWLQPKTYVIKFGILSPSSWPDQFTDPTTSEWYLKPVTRYWFLHCRNFTDMKIFQIKGGNKLSVNHRTQHLYNAVTLTLITLIIDIHFVIAPLF